MNRQKLVLWLSLFFGAANGQPKDIYFHFQKRVELDISCYEPITSIVYDNNLYYLNERIHGDAHVSSNKIDSIGIPMFVYNLTSGVRDSFLLTLPDSSDVERWSIESIAVNKKYIAIRLDGVYLFKRSNRKFVKKINLKRVSKISFIGDDSLLATENYNYNVKDDSIKTKIILYDIGYDKIIKFLKPQYDCLALTHCENRSIDNSSNFVALSNSLEYNIRFYSIKNLELASVIDNGKIETDETKIAHLSQIQHALEIDVHAKSSMDEIIKLENRVSRIDAVYFLNNQTFLVSRKYPNNDGKRTIDVWKINDNGKWIRIVADKLYNMDLTNEGDIVTAENIPMYYIYSSNVNVYDNDKICIITKFVNPEIGMKHSDHLMYQDKFFAEHDLKYQLMIYDWQIK